MGGLVWKATAYRFLDTFILIYPFYTVMFTEAGLSPAQIGVVLGAWSLTGVALEIPTGALADRLSRRWLLMAAQLFRGLGFALWVLFPGFWGFLFGLMLWGVKSALVSGTFEALLYDELKAKGRPEDYARAIGRTQTGRFIGLMSAALIAAILAKLGYGALTWLTVGCSVLAALSALALPRAPKAVTAGRPNLLGHMRAGLTEAAQRPGVLPILLFIAGMQALLAACEDYWQIFGLQIGLPSSQIALFVAGLAAAQAVGASIAHKAPLDRAGALHMLVAVGGVALVVAAALFQPWSVIPAIFFTGLCRMADVRADAQFQHALSGEARATVASVKGFASQLAVTLLILNFGLMAQFSSYRFAFLIHGVALILLGIGYTLAARRRA
jgi:MFS family permease